MFDIPPWKAWLLRATPWLIGGLVLAGMVWEFNRRGDKINRLETAQEAAQAQIAQERKSHAAQIEAYQAGLAAVENVQTRRIEVTTRLAGARTEINNAPTTTGCVDSPAIVIGLDGLRKAYAAERGADHPAGAVDVPAGANTAR